MYVNKLSRLRLLYSQNEWLVVISEFINVAMSPQEA